MPKLNFVKKHSVPMDEAKSRVKTIVEDFTRDFAKIVNTVDWAKDGQSATAKGKGFTGQFAVTADKVTVDVDLSFLATPFKGRVETTVNEKLNAAFPE